MYGIGVEIEVGCIALGGSLEQATKFGGRGLRGAVCAWREDYLGNENPCDTEYREWILRYECR